MDHRSRFSSLSASYDNFLFAPVCEDANGTYLSVISALARMDVDPWEEASRLAAMPKAIAEKTLLSIFDLVSGRSWTSSEAAAIAARLVRLLPSPSEAATNTATGTAKGPAQRISYWWVWLAFVLAMSFMTPHHQATTTNTSNAAPDSSEAAPLKNSSPRPNEIGQSR